MFQTHNVSMNEENNENPKVILRDITEERCKQHPTERAIFLCNVHDSMICGRCLHSEHLSCGKDVVDLLHEGVTIDCEKVKNMKSVLMEVKDEIQLVREDAEHSNENNNKSADKCVMACMELGNQIKQRVDELTSGIRDEIRKKYDENLSTFSRITITCNETSTWCENEKRKIDEFVDNNMAGYLYLTCRKFEKGVSEVRSRLSEIKHKHTFKGFDFKENKVILKCVFEDLGEACKQEEVTESEDGSTNNVIVATTDIKKTRQELTVLLRQAIHFLDKSEKTRKALCDELKNVKQHLDNSEKARRAFEQELLKGKQGIEHSERARQKLCDELKQVKQELDSSEKLRLNVEVELKQTKEALAQVEREKVIVQTRLSHINKHFNWTQPTGTVEVKISKDEYCYSIIVLVFTFPDGLQTTNHPSPGNPIQGGTFKGRLISDSEGELLYRMLKAAFRRGVMFNLGKEGKVVLDGVSLYNDNVYDLRWQTSSAYVKYIRTLKAELIAKGITETDIDQTERLYKTFTVHGP